MYTLVRTFIGVCSDETNPQVQISAQTDCDDWDGHKLEAIQIAESPKNVELTIDESYSSFKARILSPLSWSDVYYTERPNGTMLYLVLPE